MRPTLKMLVYLLSLFIFPISCFAQAPKIIGIDVEGNKGVPRAAILALVSTKPGETPNPEKLQRDADSIMNFGSFQEVKWREEPAEGGVRIIFEVLENPVVNEIVFKGTKVISEKELRALMKTPVGMVLNHGTLNKDLQDIENYYINKGYSLGHIVSAEISPEGVLTITVAEGEIEEITIQGLKKTNPKVIWRELSLRPGDIFDRNRFNRDLSRLYGLDLWEIEPKYEPGKDIDKFRLILDCKEKRTGIAALGMGYSSRERLIGLVDVREDNFRGLAERLNVHWEFNSRSSYELGFFEPWLDDKRTSLNFSIYDRRILRFLYYQPATGWRYDERRKGIDFLIGRPVSETMRLFVGARTESSDIYGIPGFETGTVTSFTTAAVNDTRDYPPDPKTGGREGLTLEFARPVFGGQFSFTKYDLDLRRYFAVGKDNTLAIRWLYGIGEGKRPFAEYYHLGGAENLRGYDEDWLHGHRMFLLTFEFRFPISKGLKGVTFLDMGDAWGGRPDYARHQSFSLNIGYGVGLRVETPIGPLRLDYGIGSQGGRTHFSVGPTF